MISIHSRQRDLLALPLGRRDRWYSGLLILPTQRKHKTGWGTVAIIGTRGENAECILTKGCDDVVLPVVSEEFDLRMDCTFPSRVLRLWSRDFDMSIGHYGSTVPVILQPRHIITKVEHDDPATYRGENLNLKGRKNNG